MTIALRLSYTTKINAIVIIHIHTKQYRNTSQFLLKFILLDIFYITKN